MKKSVIIIMITLLLVFGTSCAKGKDAPQSSTPSDTTSQLSPEMEAWLATANLTAKEAPDELYEKALSEDTLVIYSNSTRLMDVKDSFEKQYPGLTVYVEDVRSVNLIETVSRNFNNKDYTCDIVFCDDNGILSQEFVPKGILFKYVPYDISEKIMPESNRDLLSVVVELQQAFYNSEVYGSPPIHNWWELTEEKYKDKVVMPSPLKSNSSMGFYSMIIKNSEIMKKAYYDLYGKEIPLRPNETAGEAYWRMMFENGLCLVNSSDEVFEMVGTPGQTNPPIGIMISSKIRTRELGYEIQPIFDMDNFTGTYSSNCIMLAGGCKNINSAKLFIRWVLGESDGKGEGYKPYLQNGAWSVRTDVQSQSEVKLDEIKWLALDTKYIYENKKNTEEILQMFLKARQENQDIHDISN